MIARQSCFCRGGVIPTTLSRKRSANRSVGYKHVTRCYKDNDDPKVAGIELLADARMRNLVNNISKYCSALPSEDSNTEECWSAYHFLLDELKSAEESCALDTKLGEKDAPACSRLEHWEDFLRESEVVETANTVRVLRALNKTKDHKGTEPSGVSSFQTRDKRRKDFTDFFHAMDKDGDGRLNVEEFRSSMKKLGDEMHGSTVETILQAVGSTYGFLDLDEFLAVIEAEEIRSHSEFATIMRQGHQHQKEHKWWSD